MQRPPLTLPLRVVLLGHGRLGLALLEGLLATPQCEIVGVFRWSDRPKSRDCVDEHEIAFGKRIRALKLKEIRCKGINAYEFTRHLQKLKPSLILIGSWGEVVQSHLLNREDLLVVNCHPSKLPAHRGANPYASAIRAGETETGVTFHIVDEQIDTGPILLQETVPIPFSATGADLRDACADCAEAMVPNLLKPLTGGKKIKVLKQDETLQSYFAPLRIEDGQLHWTYEPEDLYNQVRGLYPWLQTFSFLEGKLLVCFSQAKLEAFSSDQFFPPGAIVDYRKGTLWVATRDPGMLLGFSRFQLYLLGFYLSPGLSRWLGYFWFRRGRQFKSLG